ncbi:hypothetical protein V6N00_12985 [Tersicoccus sp. MR15.9]|uniref:hypothetical protein n=1 Tax=Tersicoccus mangrovi TaxID=3121635 RepID=UPI002FE58239
MATLSLIRCDACGERLEVAPVTEEELLTVAEAANWRRADGVDYCEACTQDQGLR